MNVSNFHRRNPSFGVVTKFKRWKMLKFAYIAYIRWHRWSKRETENVYIDACLAFEVFLYAYLANERLGNIQLVKHGLKYDKITISSILHFYFVQSHLVCVVDSHDTH